MEMSFSKYKELYEILIPQDNQWRRMREEIDFSFVYDLLEDSYSKEMGRTAKDVVFMFKLLMLKTESGLSDGGLMLIFKLFSTKNLENFKNKLAKGKKCAKIY